jgi:antitoxin HigA-1
MHTMSGLATTIEASDYTSFSMPLPHPGEVLRLDFMEPMGLSAGALARSMGLPDRTRIERLARCQTAVSADTALRLGKVLGTSAAFWMNLQTQHDLSKSAIAAREELATLKAIGAAAA